MPSTKRLRSVTHSTAHHTVSGLCYVHPHLGSVCKELGHREVSVNLLAPGFKPELKEISRELKLSTNALREFFCGVLESEKINIAELNSAEAIFFFHKGRWPSASVVRVITNENKKIECCVDSSGRRGEILQASS
ncbi:MAG: hypothetical protein GY694_03655 [Gammaproteobacteria bacterium]|nr:hypothetical protein [Gammaproteobacteria bacterium]